MATVSPHFLIIGAQKCGTSSLANFLRDDPQVFLPVEKELHFFSRDRETLTEGSISKYLSNFNKARPGQFSGEATPNYLPSRFAPEKVLQVAPNARLIVILRDPTERAMSAYLHAQRMRIFPKSSTFEDVIERDARESGSRWTNIVSNGFYFSSLDHWLQHFDENQIHICLLEDFKSRFDSEIKAIYEHLGLASSPQLNQDFPHVNKARHLIAPQVNRLIANRLPVAHPLRRAFDRKSKRRVLRPEPHPRTIHFLRTTYEDQILNLGRLLGRDLTIWPSHPNHAKTNS